MCTYVGITSIGRLLKYNACHKHSMTVNQLLCCGPERSLFTAIFKNIFEFQSHWYYVDLGAVRCEWENRSTRTKYAMFFIFIRASTIPLTAGNISRGFSFRDVFFARLLSNIIM